MKKALSVIIVLLLTGMIILPLSTYSVKASPKTIIVPDNYPTISAAIGNASQGDTINVKSGVYYENPVVDKSLSLISEDVGGAAVVGDGGVDRGAKPVFTIAADNVELSGFTIQSRNYSSTAFYATGIVLAANNCTINGNNISGTYYGVFTSFTSSSTITNNIVTAAIKDGVRICGGSLNTISHNLINGNAVSGIALAGYSDMITDNSLCGNGRGLGLGASYCTVFGNNFTGNDGIGLYLGGSSCLITSNYIAQNVWGIYLTADFPAPNNNNIYRNNFVNNSDPVATASTLNGQFWDNGSEGNCWSNYNGTDVNGDGIGDSPYTVYEGNVDRYPLMNQVSITQGAQPALPTTPAAVNGAVAQWNFDEVEPNGVTPDSIDYNPAIVEMSDGVMISPKLVEGVSGNALRFNGSDYAYVSASPTLNIKGEVTVDAWINVQEYKDVEYNVIIELCLRTQNPYPTRIFGFATNGVPPENSSSPALGALRGFFLDDQGVFNEIVTTQSVVPLNQWTHVVFVRSLTTGMHIYVNGFEESVEVTSGVQNPTGQVTHGSEFYIGHDSMSTLDNLSISTIAVEPQASPVWMEWWFWAAVATVVIVIAAAVYFLRRKNPKDSSNP